MRISLLLISAGLLALAGCTGSGSGSGTGLQVHCGAGEPFCLASCDLGCDSNGHCALNQIAENQRLHFVFSQAVDPATVNSTSFSLRTATGLAPDGNITVDGTTITFTPTVRQSSSGTTFGFERGETYIFTLAGGPDAGYGIASLSGGNRLRMEISCQLQVTLGIIDEDQQPPTVTLVVPTDLQNAPVDTSIVLRFSELIDTTAFGSTSSPITYQLRRVRPNATGYECDPTSQTIALSGVPAISVETVGTKDVTVVTMRPTILLPGLACVEVIVTSDVRDLSGRPSAGATFQFLTTAANISDSDILETFASNVHQDLAASSGVWGSGAATAGKLGGDGRHGTFHVDDGVPLGNNTFQWSTDNFTIPAGRTFDGNPATITDGKFYFSDFSLPQGYTMHIVGSVSPQIYVRGRLEVIGKIDVNGTAMTTFNARSSTLGVIAGQTGGVAGPGGAAGGQGGDKCDGRVGPVGITNSGRNGHDVLVALTHAYFSRTIGTGGLGSGLFPVAGTNTAAFTNLVLGSFAGSVQRGGSGGGFWTQGSISAIPSVAVTAGSLTPAQPNLVDSGNASSAGTTTLLNDATKNWTPNQFVGLLLHFGSGSINGQERYITANTATTITVSVAFTLPTPAAAAYTVGGTLAPAFNPFLDPTTGALPPISSSLNHFTIGGSGGGGGGSHPLVSQSGQTIDVYMAGGGGSGGGGALVLRSGSDVALRAAGRLESKGGAGVQINGDDPTTPSQDRAWGVACPGGGGSGGCILIQSGTSIDIEGAIDTSGSGGSSIGGVIAPFNTVSVIGGAGASGTYRLEAANGLTLPAPSASLIPAFHQPRHTALLTDTDQLVGSQSLWRSTNRVFPPSWIHYILEVDSDGNGTTDQVYSDDPAYTIPTGSPGVLMGAADNNNVPVRLRFQGGQMTDPATTPTAGTIGPWRDYLCPSNTAAATTMNADNATAFRFVFTFNRGMFPTAAVRKLTVRIRG